VNEPIDGLFDLQVNGFAGIDFNDDAITAGALDHALAAMRACGVSHCLPTLITAHEATLAARLAALDAAVAGSRFASMVPGYHLEGPFLSPAQGYAGCHPAAAMVAPDTTLLDRLRAIPRRPVLMLTLAPELPGAIALIRDGVGRGMVVALGHTSADRQTIEAAAEAGATLSTHLGNALPQPQPKFDNPLMAQLAEDRLTATLIADGIHVPPHALKAMIRAKGDANVILVTDATAAAESPPGRYKFASMTLAREADGRVHEPDSARLAGSSLTLDQAVRNIVAWHIAPLSAALRYARENPRTVLQPALNARGIVLPPVA
jgi:N-acetylglucosamine-6-phosphate deacetylase